MRKGCAVILAVCVLLAVTGCESGGGDDNGGGGSWFPAGVAIERVSISSGDTEGDAQSSQYDVLDLSGDGRYAVFTSDATNLVPDDTNGVTDVFVRDRLLGTTSRVSVSSTGTQANGNCYSYNISGNGRLVVFSTTADNLVPNDTNGGWDVFVHDRVTGETSRVSISTAGVQGNGWSYPASISANGRYVAFTSFANNLDPDHPTGTAMVYVRDLMLGVTTRVDLASDGTQGNGNSIWGASLPDLSADGRFVAFQSVATNLVPDDTNGAEDIFVHDRQTGETTRVSVSSAGAQGDDDSIYPYISADGRYVAFTSYATDLVADDTNGVSDVFVHDRKTGLTTRLSVTSAGAQGAGESYASPISGTGRYVAFLSFSQLDPAAALAVPSIYVHDNVTGKTLLASKNAAGEQNDLTAEYSYSAISANGNYVLFAADATNLVADDTNGVSDAFAAPNPALP